MASIPNGSTKDTSKLGIFSRADTERFWWIRNHYLLTLCRYVVLNPVRVKIVKDPIKGIKNIGCND